MQHELIVLPDAAAVAHAAAERVAEEARAAVAARGVFSLAVSGGRSPWAMFADLAELTMPWESVELYQVDERVAPEGDPARNLTHLRESIGPQVPVVIHPMPVNADDLEAAARRRADRDGADVGDRCHHRTDGREIGHAAVRAVARHRRSPPESVASGDGRKMLIARDLTDANDSEGDGVGHRGFTS